MKHTGLWETIFLAGGLILGGIIGSVAGSTISKYLNRRKEISLLEQAYELRLNQFISEYGLLERDMVPVKGNAPKDTLDYTNQLFRVFGFAHNSVQTLKDSVDTPEKARMYTQLFDFGPDSTPTESISLSQINKRMPRRLSCKGSTTSIAALLKDDGYPPYGLVMEYLGKPGHLVFIWKTEDGYIHSIGQNFRDGQKDKTLGGLVKKISRAEGVPTPHKSFIVDISKLFPSYDK